MKLKDCKLGEIVEKEDGTIGHIVGLSKNCHGETIPVVRFCKSNEYNEEVTIHYSNIEKL